MSWRDELRPGSFRGVPFEMVELTVQSGRRVVANVSPETNDLPPTADLGRKRPGYRMRGFVIGDDVFDRLDRVLAALNADGPAELVHPWRGRVHVQVGDVSHTHDLSHGWCVIEFDAVDHGGQARPFVAVVPGAAITAQADTAYAAASAHYGDVFDVSDAFRQAVLIAETAMGTGGLVGDFDPTGGVAAAFRAVNDAVALLAFVQSARGYLFHGLGTPSDDAREAEADAIYEGLRVLALIRVVELTVAETFISADAAERTMATIAIELSDWMSGILDMDLFTALSDLRTSLVDTLSQVAVRLPRERTIEIQRPRPALVIAYDTYGARRLPAREAELIRLNSIGHPGFVYGDVKVLDR